MGNNVRTRTYSQRTYIDGNTVRYMEAAPDIRRRSGQDAQTERNRRISSKERKRRQEQNRQNAAAARNRERALSLGYGYVAFLTLAAIVVAVSAVFYIRLQSDITAHIKQISTLESQLEDVRMDNDATQKRINSEIDLTHVKDVAINRLGMVYAGENQIAYYTVDNNDYLNQYEDIP